MGDDKFGGRSVNIGRAMRFQKCLDNCRMMDSGFTGPRYTWSNHRPLSDLVQERINRVFVNSKWNDLHLEAAVFHLEKNTLIPLPCKVVFKQQLKFHPPRSFRFQPMWLSHPSFLGVVRDAWTNPPSLHQAKSTFIEKANAWDRAEFRNLFHRKRRILARIKGIQENLLVRPNNFLVDLERKLRLEYAKVAKLEEEFWAMKTHILWFVEGD